MDSEKTILIFAGSGASKAVAPNEYPTTVEFFNDLPDPIKTNALFSAVEQFIRKEHGEEQLDIELILWRLNELKSFCAQINNHSHIPGWMFNGNRLPIAIGHNSQNFGQLHEIARATESNLTNLIGRINERVYGHYSRLPTDTELAGTWIPLLEGCAKLGARIEIVTTNYDMVIETALDKNGIADSGWRGSIVRKLDTQLWSNGISNRSKGLLTKLHGSVNWTKDENEIYISGPLFTGKHESHMIIYPGFKGRPSEPTFLGFHDHFRKCLEAASVAIFIGFAFRDEYINEIIKQSISENTAILVINPQKVNVPLDDVRYKHIKSSFDIETICEVTRYFQNRLSHNKEPQPTQ